MTASETRTPHETASPDLADVPAVREAVTEEMWRPVVGFEGYYEVSNYGGVRGLPRIDGMGRALKGGRMALSVGYCGRLQIKLMINGIAFRKRVHRLVLEAFVGPCPEGLVCCHNDGDHTNNHVSNLRWDTLKSNAQDTIAHGRNPGLRKVACRLGHLLQAPNLVSNGPKRRCRACRACVRARATGRRARRRGEVVDLAELANAHYREIMKDVPGVAC